MAPASYFIFPTRTEESIMQMFKFSDGKVFRGVITRARINREQYRDVIILACSKADANVFAEYDRSLRLNEALSRMFSDRHPELTGDALTEKYNAWEPSREDIEEATFLVDNRIMRTDGIRELINGDTHAYYSARLSRGNNGMPTFVPFTPKDQSEQQSEVAEKHAEKELYTVPEF
jgi:hypothetical protein